MDGGALAENYNKNVADGKRTFGDAGGADACRKVFDHDGHNGRHDGECELAGTLSGSLIVGNRIRLEMIKTALLWTVASDFASERLRAPATRRVGHHARSSASSPSKSRYSDPRIISSSRECMHAPLYPHSTSKRHCLWHQRGATSPWVQQLTPARCASTSRHRRWPHHRTAAVGFDTAMAGWHDIEVPLSWQMDPEVADEPLYTNTRYALPGIDRSRRCVPFLYPHDRTIRSARTSDHLYAAQILEQAQGPAAN